MTQTTDPSRTPPNGKPSLEGKSVLRQAAILSRRALTGPCSPWDMAPRRDDFSDVSLYRRAAGIHRRLYLDEKTMMSNRRGRALARAGATIVRENIPGAIVDCGVWNGGSTVLLGTFARDRQVWAFDSFEGLPVPSSIDGADSFVHVGDCLGSEDQLRASFAARHDSARLHVVKGWFEETFQRTKAAIGPIAVLHADGDWYESVRLTLESFYDQVSPGGYIIIDDYGHWIGARRATDEFRAAVGDRAELQSADYSGRYWRKPPQ